MEYKIYWKSRLTGATGNGSPVSKDAAEAGVKIGDNEYPEIKHWIAPVR